MAIFEAFIDVPAEKAVKLQFEQQLEDLVRQELCKKLAHEIIYSKELQINRLQLNPTLNDPWQTGTRFYINVDVHNL